MCYLSAFPKSSKSSHVSSNLCKDVLKCFPWDLGAFISCSKMFNGVALFILPDTHRSRTTVNTHCNFLLFVLNPKWNFYVQVKMNGGGQYCKFTNKGKSSKEESFNHFLPPDHQPSWLIPPKTDPNSMSSVNLVKVLDSQNNLTSKHNSGCFRAVETFYTQM